MKILEKEKRYLVVFVGICVVCFLLSRFGNLLRSNTDVNLDASNAPLTPGKAMVYGQKININEASLRELEALPMIGPKRAQKIITWREKNGPFLSWESLLQIRGISKRVLDQVRPYGVLKNSQDER